MRLPSPLQHSMLWICVVFGTLALYDALGWLLPHFGLLAVAPTMALCLALGTMLGLHLARHS